MTLATPALATAALIICCAYTVYGLTGFGSSITAMPLLVLLMPLRLALPIMVVFDLIAGSMVGLKNCRCADRGEIFRLLPFLLLGMLVGVTVLVHVPEQILLLLLGSLVLVYCAWTVVAGPGAEPISARWSAPFGFGGGVFTSLFGTGGPLYTIYLSRRLRDKSALRATISLLVFMAGLMRLVIFSSVGLYNQQGLFRLVGLLLPCSLAGLYLGTQLHRRAEPKRVMQVVWLTLVVAGIGLIRKAVQA
jgi:uncharacterized protein